MIAEKECPKGEATTSAPEAQGRSKSNLPGALPSVALLTGGGDKPYALGMAAALISEGICFDFIGSDDHSAPDLQKNPLVNFLNLRGSQNSNVPRWQKMARVLRYYARLVKYAATAKPKIFHILWHNKFELFDRTVLLLFYRLLGKRILFTAHNVNAGQRDGRDGFFNRASLKVQYRLFEHIFVHTEKMKLQLMEEFAVPIRKVSVIPFGINNTVPNGKLTPKEAKAALGIAATEKVLLFFGGITPYKGLEYLVDSLSELTRSGGDFRLVIAGKPKEDGTYWRSIQEQIAGKGLAPRVIIRSEHIPDEDIELYFKAADVLILPYTHIFQSGVLFLGYSFGLPVIAADVGSLREDIIHGQTGFLFRPSDPMDLAKSIRDYFSSALYADLGNQRGYIARIANDRYSWSKVAAIVSATYQTVLR